MRDWFAFGEYSAALMLSGGKWHPRRIMALAVLLILVGIAWNVWSVVVDLAGRIGVFAAPTLRRRATR